MSQPIMLINTIQIEPGKLKEFEESVSNSLEWLSPVQSLRDLLRRRSLNPSFGRCLYS